MNIEEIPDKDRVKNKRYLIKFLGIAAMNDELDSI